MVINNRHMAYKHYNNHPAAFCLFSGTGAAPTNNYMTMKGSICCIDYCAAWA
jgi:hypothetical protein